jgi:hypothetical protein
MSDFREQVIAHIENANLQAEVFLGLLRERKIWELMRAALRELPCDAQMEIADALLANLGMVAVRTPHFYDDNDPPHLVAMKAWCRDNGFVAIGADEYDRIRQHGDRAS